MKVYCFHCGVWMEKIKTGITVQDHGLTYRGDSFKCPTCRFGVISDFGKPYQTEPVPYADADELAEDQRLI